MAVNAQMERGERRICLILNGIGRHGWLRLPLQTASRLGNGAIWYIAMVGLALFCGKAGIVLPIQLLLTGVAGNFAYKTIKLRFKRLRPCERYREIRIFSQPMDRFSFPSGHSLHAVSFSILIATALPILSWPLLVLTLMIAISRVVLGHHYLSDVIAGVVLGILLAQLSLIIHPVQAVMFSSV